MTSSAILEVRLFWQKRWTVRRIAVFTYQLRRRRVRAQRRVAAAGGIPSVS